MMFNPRDQGKLDWDVSFDSSHPYGIWPIAPTLVQFHAFINKVE